MSRRAGIYWIAVGLAVVVLLVLAIVGWLGTTYNREDLQDAMIPLLLTEFGLVAVAITLRGGPGAKHHPR